ncbi:MAG: hypothetical protein QF632_00025 [Candidatus Woesearchaeota archaeon]|jgi:hypothetical protein|nr:hypothetical protein [Candidatus Woesearchaeota archaeon]MDP7323128.1 hypothetical protein [Candidatus Woesearchaeota archaeon]MDP7458331.1 hypothetical protein [Candidatus Woesearchaeota archaeon]
MGPHINSHLESYHSALERLPIENPTFSDFKSLLPHLSASELGGLMDSDGYTLIAAPPLLVKGAFQGLCYENRVTRPEGPRIFSAGSGRIVTKRDRAFERSARALAFAYVHWKDKLIEDKWEDVGSYVILDLNDLHGGDFPRIVDSVYYATMSPFKELQIGYGNVNDPSLIGPVVIGRILGREMEGNRYDTILDGRVNKRWKDRYDFAGAVCLEDGSTLLRSGNQIRCEECDTPYMPSGTTWQRGGGNLHSLVRWQVETVRKEHLSERRSYLSLPVRSNFPSLHARVL